MLDALVRDEQVNAVLGWTLVGVVVCGAVWSLLAGSVLWGGFSLLVAAVVSLPATIRGRTTMVPWPLSAVVAAAVVVGAAGRHPETAGYVAVAGLALVVVVELDAFTAVELSRRFAVGFAVLTTMAVQALWIVAQFLSDRWFETEFLRSQTELQVDIVVVTAVGVVLGGGFYWYVSRFDPVGVVDRSSTRRGAP